MHVIEIPCHFTFTESKEMKLDKWSTLIQIAIEQPVQKWLLIESAHAEQAKDHTHTFPFRHIHTHSNTYTQLIYQLIVTFANTNQTHDTMDFGEPKHLSFITVSSMRFLYFHPLAFSLSLSLFPLLVIFMLYIHKHISVALAIFLLHFYFSSNFLLSDYLSLALPLRIELIMNIK